MSHRTTTRLTPSQRLLATGLVLGVTLVAFEVTAIVTAMPTITDELGGTSLYGLAVAVYTLANMVALVAAGELADRRGPVLPYVASIGTFVAGLLVASWAPSMVWVVVGRTLQGAGTGGLQPIAYTLVQRAFPEDRRPTMYAILSAGWVLPSLFAPAMSGWVVDAFGWRWVFLGIIPFAVAVAALAVRPMRQYGPTDTEARGTRMPQAVAAACGVGAFCTGVQVAQPAVAVAVTLAGVAVALPALRTLLPAGVGRAAPGLPAIAACRILATAAFLGADSFIPLAADRIHGARPLVQGFVIIGAAVSWTIGQWVRTKRPGRSPAAAVRTGFLVLCLGLVLCLPVLWQGWPLWATFLGWSVGGLGMGLLYNPSTVATMSYATPGNEGRTSSVISLSDALGFSVMGGIGGATVAVADRHGSGIPTAIGVNIALAIALTLVGAAASRRIRSASA
jgi:MFS family permease